MDRATAAVRLLAGDKEPVRAATTANVSLSGLLTVDGVTLVAGDRVLVKDQTDATENGVYTASAGTWYRAPDSNSSRVLIKGMKVAVQEGTIHAGQVWNLVTNRPNLGDDDIEWEFYLSSDMVTQINNAANDIIGTIIGLTNAADFASRAIASGTTLPSGMTYLRTAGYAAAGDGGGALYKKVVSEPTHSGKFQSADGAWWEVVYLGQPMNLLQFGALGDNTTDDRAAMQGAIDFVSASGGGVVRGVAGKAYRCVIDTGVTDFGLIIKPGVTLSLNMATINVECDGGVFGVRLQSNAHIVGPGTVKTAASTDTISQNIHHSPISVGPSYGSLPSVADAASSPFASPSGWSIRNLTVESVVDHIVSGDPVGTFICVYGGSNQGVIEDITIAASASVAIGIGMDWAPVGGLSSSDIAASRTLFNAGSAYTLHPHDIEVRRVKIGSLSVPKTAGNTFGSHGIRLSGCYNIHVSDVTMAGTTYAGIAHWAGDLGFEFAPTAVKPFRNKGTSFRNIRIENANNGWGVFCNCHADNVALAVSGSGYSPILPTQGETNILFENVFTQGSNSANAWPGFRIQNQRGGKLLNCHARLHSVGVLVETDMDRLQIIGGEFESNWTRGIHVTSSNPAEDLIIDGAQCYSNGLGGGSTDAGIELGATVRPIVKNCVLGSPSDSFQDFGIRCTNACSAAIIENNQVIGVATSGVAYSIASTTDYDVLALFNGNKAESTITTKYAGANIIPYAYQHNLDQDRTVICRAKRSSLTGDTTPAAGSWKGGDIIFFTNPSAAGKIGSTCTSTGSPGTWKQFGAIDS